MKYKIEIESLMENQISIFINIYMYINKLHNETKIYVSYKSLIGYIRVLM